VWNNMHILSNIQQKIVYGMVNDSLIACAVPAGEGFLLIDLHSNV